MVRGDADPDELMALEQRGRRPALERRPWYGVARVAPAVGQVVEGEPLQRVVLGCRGDGSHAAALTKVSRPDASSAASTTGLTPLNQVRSTLSRRAISTW